MALLLGCPIDHEEVLDAEERAEGEDGAWPPGVYVQMPRSVSKATG